MEIVSESEFESDLSDFEESDPDKIDKCLLVKQIDDHVFVDADQQKESKASSN